MAHERINVVESGAGEVVVQGEHGAALRVRVTLGSINEWLARELAACLEDNGAPKGDWQALELSLALGSVTLAETVALRNLALRTERVVLPRPVPLSSVLADLRAGFEPGFA